MKTLSPLVVFTIGRQRFGLPVRSVERVVRAAAIRRLRDAPFPLIGLIDIKGVISPVLDLRTEGALNREISVDDLFLIAHEGANQVVIVAESIEGVYHEPANARAIDYVPLHHGMPSSVLRHPDGMILLHDVGSLLADGVIGDFIRRAIREDA